VLSLYKVSPEVIENAGYIINVVSLFLWVRVNNMTTVVGILRAGGDTRFSLFLDGIIIWIVGVPMAYLSICMAFPVYLVYLCATSEEGPMGPGHPPLSRASGSITSPSMWKV
jgi:Na+-driven multidrug efflux pump